MFEVDHLFVCTEVGAPEAERFVAFGLTEGEPNVHPGQGTANRRFFFRNVFLELLWVSDPAEAQSELVRPTQLWQRWSQRRSGASPFGVLLRPTHPGTEGVPFPCWEYKPPYLPSPRVIHLGEGVPLSEPSWGYLAFSRRPDAPERPRHQPMAHGAGFQEVTHLHFTSPAADSPSAAARAVAGAAVALEPGPEHLLEITFDGGVRGKSADFRPALPLVFRW
jgi:hypothetical protein